VVPEPLVRAVKLFEGPAVIVPLGLMTEMSKAPRPIGAVTEPPEALVLVPTAELVAWAVWAVNCQREKFVRTLTVFAATRVVRTRLADAPSPAIPSQMSVVAFVLERTSKVHLTPGWSIWRIRLVAGEQFVQRTIRSPRRGVNVSVMGTLVEAVPEFACSPTPDPFNGAAEIVTSVR
jgi:hypothetical protein